MKKICSALIMIVVSLVFGFSTADAAEAELAISAVLPENQQAVETGYFDLLVKPGGTQTLQVKLKNLTAKDITTEVTVNTATTSYMGSIDYSQKYEAKGKDTSLLHPLSEILIPEKKEVIVAAEKEITLKLKLAVPTESFDGIILGAIRIDQMGTSPSKEDKDDGGMVINNKFAYSIGVRLSEGEALKTASELKVLRVEADQQIGRNQVFAHLQHSTSDIVEKVSYEGKITKKNSQEVIHSSKKKNFRIAPNSTYFFPISWENQRFEAGDYNLSLKVKSEESPLTWEFDEPFTITRKEAQKLNEKAVDMGTDYYRWLLIGGIITMIIIVLVVSIVIGVSFLRKQEEARERQRRQLKKKTKKSKNSSNKKRSSRQGGR